MRFLGLDIGTRRTGVAYFEDGTDILLPLDTLTHKNDADVLSSILDVARERKIDCIVAGMPFLPSGTEGSQAKWVTGIIDNLRKEGFRVEILDERYTTKDGKHADAQAAVSILQTYLDIRSKQR